MLLPEQGYKRTFAPEFYHSKMISAHEKLSDVVCRNIDLLPVIYRFGIKSEIRQKSIAEVCSAQGIDLPLFLAVVNTFDSDDYFPKPQDLELQPLINFLVSTHTYLKEITIPFVTSLVDRLKEESEDKKFVNIIEQYFNKYVHHLLKHIEFEEKNIFPLVEQGDKKRSKTSKQYLKDLFRQHENVEGEISDLLTIIIQHIPDKANIRIIHEVLHALSHFEKEQVDHSRFEDKILVPKLMAILS
jgi:regulator of cell morphogenesis and NO signaling